MKIQYEVMGTHQVHEAHVAVLPQYGDTVWFEDENGTEHVYEVRMVLVQMFKEPPEAGTVVAELRVVGV
jgi:hypothetical protein